MKKLKAYEQDKFDKEMEQIISKKAQYCFGYAVSIPFGSFLIRDIVFNTRNEWKGEQ